MPRRNPDKVFKGIARILHKYYEDSEDSSGEETEYEVKPRKKKNVVVYEDEPEEGPEPAKRTRAPTSFNNFLRKHSMTPVDGSKKWKLLSQAEKDKYKNIF